MEQDLRITCRKNCLLFYLPCVKDNEENQNGEDRHDVLIALEQGNKLVQLCPYLHFIVDAG